MAEVKELTPKEAAALLGVTPATIIRRIKEGEYPAIRRGNRWIIPVGALDGSGCPELDMEAQLKDALKG